MATGQKDWSQRLAGRFVAKKSTCPAVAPPTAAIKTPRRPYGKRDSRATAAAR
jgi:hypothetical protein